MAVVGVALRKRAPAAQQQQQEHPHEKEVQQQDLSTEHVLSHHRMLQDDIAESMVGMARNLKDRSVAFGEALREDSKVSA